MVADPGGSRPAGPGRAAGNPWLRVAAGLVLLEAAALFAGAVYLGVESAVGEADDPATAWLSAGMAVLAAVGLAFVGLALSRGRRWARAPAVVVQLLALPVGVPLVQGGQLVAGVPVCVAAVAGLVLLLSAPVSRSLQG